jgi:hypothetical protein
MVVSRRSKNTFETQRNKRKRRRKRSGFQIPTLSLSKGREPYPYEILKVLGAY